MIQNLKNNLSNLPGWRSNRRIVVFESDDWGSVGTPSTKVYEELLKKSIIVENTESRYLRYDALESNEDLASLFEVLSSIKDRTGNHAVFTALNVVANPDFQRIEDSAFEAYYFEPLSQTITRYTSSNQVINLWKEGYVNRLFVPQFHGREHLNVTAWMQALKESKPKTRTAFQLGVYGIDPVELGESRIHYRAAFDIQSTDELELLRSVIIDGINLFKELVGYNPVFFVPTNGPFNLSLEETLSECGIRFLTLDKFQKEPIGNHRYRTRIRYLGKRNGYDQIYLSRNAAFEPSMGRNNHVDHCLADIQRAFRWKKPATVSTHRLNYIGSLFPENRDNGLRQLKELLNRIVSSWPDVEFMTSDQLGTLITTTA